MTKFAVSVFGVLCGAGLSVLGIGVNVPFVSRVNAQAAAAAAGQEALSSAAQTALVKQYCVKCHNDSDLTGDVSLEHFTGSDQTEAALAAAMVRRLKAGEMPPAGEARPDTDVVTSFVASLEVAAIPGLAAGGGAAPAGAVAPKVIAYTHTGDVMPVAAQNAMVHEICTQCHTDKRKAGGVSFEQFDMTKAPEHASLAENMIAKLRAGMMPPQDAPKRPDAASIQAFVTSLETRLDRAAAVHPNPGSRLFQRLNRVEYASSIRAMLGLDVDVSQWLPPDTMSHNFDNISAAEGLSPTLLQSYLEAADEISRLAVGDPGAAPTSVSYEKDNLASQMHHLPGAPIGTRGGISVVHTFPADGKYRFKMLFFDTPLGVLFGATTMGEQLEVSIDGQRAALLDINPTMNEEDPKGLTLETPPIDIKAGAQRVSAVFLRRSYAPIDDLISPHEFTLADPNIGSAPGITTLPYLRNMTIAGPFSVTGISDTASRRRVFICRPLSAGDEIPCARKIIANLIDQAYRRPSTTKQVDDLLKFYTQGRTGHDFESGVRLALQAILVSPRFLFRVEQQPTTIAAGQTYAIADLDLASRLSYFLWATPPDEELLKTASAGRLHESAVLDAQVHRMLKDPRSIALATRFAAQWLRLQDVDKVHPDPVLYDFERTTADAMKQETMLFVDSILRDDRSVLDLLTADYTFVNERLASFYGIPDVAGPQFRRVSLEGTNRRGLLGQGSILVETSVANRTSPVQRGKWVLEVLLGQPPPPPPPSVPALEDTAGVSDGHTLSVRERMEEHRKNPFCASCHKVIDPIGLSLENFDPTGHWRIRDNGVPVDASTVMFDGTKMQGLSGLIQAMLQHQDTFIRVFTENLMAYALGRQVDDFDMPTVRTVVHDAASNGNHFSSFILGIVNSHAFRMGKAEPRATRTASVRPNRHAPVRH